MHSTATSNLALKKNGSRYHSTTAQGRYTTQAVTTTTCNSIDMHCRVNCPQQATCCLHTVCRHTATAQHLQSLLLIHEHQDPLQVSSVYEPAYSIHSVPSCGLKVHMSQLWWQVGRWLDCSHQAIVSSPSYTEFRSCSGTCRAFVCTMCDAMSAAHLAGQQFKLGGWVHTDLLCVVGLCYWDAIMY